MTTAVFTRAARTADQIREESRQLDPVKVLLTLAFALPVTVGWVARKVCVACWTVFSWTWTAVVVGWRSAGPQGSGKT